MTGGFREMFQAKLRKRLRSGFTTTVVMRTFVYRRPGGKPVRVIAHTLRAVYDLWEQTYFFTIETSRGVRHRKLHSEKQVVDRLTSYWRFPLGSIAQFKNAQEYFVAAVIEVNPMQPEVLAEVRRWLRQPSTGRRRMSGESFFGSFVSIFVNNKVRRAEKTFKVQSQPFFRQR